MTYKTLPAPAKANEQVREYTAAVEKGFKSMFVMPSVRGWRVILIGNQKVIGTFATKTEALRAAKNQATALDSAFLCLIEPASLSKHPET